ncbi:MAG: tetratricopeptide repeat protein [Clostridia bacterium]|nr:tetratricopeptide repeat protein [Clostridia bacterium]
MCIIVPYFLVRFTIDYFGYSMGFGVMILICIALFLYLKPKIYTAWAWKKYSKNHDEGFKMFQKAYDTGKMSAQQSLMYAYLLIRDGHIVKAEKLITSILLQKKSSLTKANILAADLNLAIIYWKKNNIDEAIEKMEYIYSKGYRSTVHYGTLGIFYILNNQLERALEFCTEAYEYNSGDASIRDNLGLVYIKKGDWVKAEEIYEALFEETTPNFIEAFYNYATVLEHRGDYAGACEFYQKALGCPEKYLSTIKRVQVEYALSRAEEHIS